MSLRQFTQASEHYLAHRLRQHGINVDLGVTTTEIRRDRARTAIRDAELQAVVIGRKDGKALTYAEYFEHCYGEPL